MELVQTRFNQVDNNERKEGSHNHLIKRDLDKDRDRVSYKYVSHLNNEVCSSWLLNFLDLTIVIICLFALCIIHFNSSTISHSFQVLIHVHLLYDWGTKQKEEKNSFHFQYFIFHRACVARSVQCYQCNYYEIVPSCFYALQDPYVM